MKQPIDLRPDHAKIVHEIIARYLPAGVSVRVFGSRAKWTAKPHSDLDLALKGKELLPRSVLGDLAEAFSESDLPFRVDVVDWHTVALSFQEVIDRDAKSLGWPVITLGEVASEITVGHVGSMANEYVSEGIPFLRSLNIEPYRISLQDLKFISPDFHKRLKKSALKPGDVVIVRTGKPGVCSVIPDWLSDANCSDLVIVRCGSEIRPRYLAYWANSLASHHIGSNLVGAVQQHFNVGAARQMPILLPLIEEQDRILSVLGTMDDKIELNRRINETLEGMAQAIFRDWFVDFGPVRRKAAGETDAVAIMGGLTPDPVRAAQLAALFPDAFGDDGLPVGWQRLHLSDIASQGKGSINPQGQPETVFEHYSLPAFDKGQEPSMDAGSTIKSNKTPVPLGSILLSKLNPETLRVWLPKDHAGAVQIASTEFLVFIPKPDASRSLLFALFRDPDFRTLMQGMVTGTSKSHQRISPPALLAQEVIAADVGLFPAFSALVEPMLERLLASRAENKSLAETRDYLLPRLMSGTVRVARESEAA